MMNKVEAIMNALKEMTNDELVSVWNEYCDANNMYDDRIYYMSELDEVFSGQDATYILNRAFFGHDQWGDESEFNPNRDFFTFNGYGNLISLDWIAFNEYAGKFGDCIDEDALADYIADNEDSLYNDSLEAVLSEIKEGLE